MTQWRAAFRVSRANQTQSKYKIIENFGRWLVLNFFAFSRPVASNTDQGHSDKHQNVQVSTIYHHTTIISDRMLAKVVLGFVCFCLFVCLFFALFFCVCLFVVDAVRTTGIITLDCKRIQSKTLSRRST